MKGRRRFISEINLTPLLDVLFSILFIVMMTGMQNEQSMKSNYQDQLDRLTQENKTLSENLERREEQLSTYDEFKSDALIITVNNIIRDDDHYLMFYEGNEEEKMGSIPMGPDKTENTKARVEGLITEKLDEGERKPVYIIFYCDKKSIYTSEYKAVYDKFNELQQNRKEVFFKVMQKEEDAR